MQRCHALLQRRTPSCGSNAHLNPGRRVNRGADRAAGPPASENAAALLERGMALIVAELTPDDVAELGAARRFLAAFQDVRRTPAWQAGGSSQLPGRAGALGGLLVRSRLPAP